MPRRIQIHEQSPNFSGQYGVIPIAFEVREHIVVETTANGTHGARFTRRAVQTPYTKDYDAFEGQRPQDWAKRWDLTRWRLYAAFLDDEHVGGAAIILDATQVYGDGSDSAEAVLWDIRVRPDQRNRGVGRRLLAFAEDQARAAGKLRMSVETQNNNVPACCLYASAGYTLRSIAALAYPMLPDEVQFVWSKPLAGLPTVD